MDTSFIIRAASDPTAVAAAAADVIERADRSLPVTHVMTMDALLSDSLSRAASGGTDRSLCGTRFGTGRRRIYGVMGYT